MLTALLREDWDSGIVVTERSTWRVSRQIQLRRRQRRALELVADCLSDAPNPERRFAPCSPAIEMGRSRGNASTTSVMRVLHASSTGVIKKESWWISDESAWCLE